MTFMIQDWRSQVLYNNDRPLLGMRKKLQKQGYYATILNITIMLNNKTNYLQSYTAKLMWS